MAQQPELGQLAFGHSAALLDLAVEPDVADRLWPFFERLGLSEYGNFSFDNACVPRGADPFATIETNVFLVRPYNWTMEEGDEGYDPRCAVNFEYRGAAAAPFRMSWYKYFGRSMWIDRDIADDLDAILADCEASLPDNFSSGFHVYDHAARLRRFEPRSKTRPDGSRLSYAFVDIAPLQGNGAVTRYACFDEDALEVLAALAQGAPFAFDSRPARKYQNATIVKAGVYNGDNVAT